MSSLTFLVTAFVVALVLLIDWWTVSRTQPGQPPQRTWMPFLLHAGLIESAVLVDGLNYTAMLYLTIPFPARFWLGQRAAWGSSILVFAWMTLKFMWFKPGWPQDTAALNTHALFALALILITVMAEIVAQERAQRRRAENLLADLKQSHNQLADYARRVAALATVEERNRLAREIHDSLGHSLTVIGVQLEKALLLAEDDPPAALNAVQNAKRTVDTALVDVRQSVGTLRHRSIPFNLRAALDRLIAGTQGFAFDIHLTIQGDEARSTDVERHIVFRAVQEAVTNVQKHAQASRVDIQIDFREAFTTLCVQDDGVGLRSDPFTGGGYGLRGIRERVETNGGQFRFSSGETCGTRLDIHLPAPTNHLFAVDRSAYDH
ncbi:MAG: sensor histidine kinase [bacterium]|nr:sensor histidine kinase [bacterium]